mgnify:CR=1 FL=1|tara:strand:+ start:710 stop:1348 length:639 start_codon:yes stop_codon:yes gene_type:complete
MKGNGMNLAIQRTKAFYERHAKTYLQGRDPYFLDEEIGHFAYFFLQYQDKKGELLDIGCANALRYPSLKLHLSHTRYVGADIAQAFITMAQERYPCIDFYLSDITDWDILPQKQFAGVWCSSVLQHIPEELFAVALSNLYRLLLPGGVAYISLPTSHVAGNPNDTRHFTIFSPEEQREWLHRAGFKILYTGETQGFQSPDVWKTYIVRRDLH